MSMKRPLSFDTFWNRIDAESLKRVAKNYGGKPTWRRDECINFLQAAIKDEERVKYTVNLLSDHNRAILAMVKYLGGEVERNRLKMAVYAAGIELPGARYGYLDPFEDALRKFLRGGLIMNNTEYGSPTDLRDYWGAVDIIFSDERVLTHVGPPNFKPIEAQPVTAPESTQTRIPRLITMQIVGVLHAIESLHGLKITKSHEVRVTEIRKLTKQLDWKDDRIVEGDLILPDAIDFTVYSLINAGLLDVKNELLMPTAFAQDFVSWPVENQVRLLLQGILLNKKWFETDQFYQGSYNSNWMQGRFALKTFLNCLKVRGTDAQTFFSIDDIDQVLFQRIGEHFRLLGTLSHFQSMDRDLKSAERSYMRWLAGEREKWLKTERIWVEQSFRTWLYFLGLVTLEMRDGKVAAAALSELGQAVLNPQPDEPIQQDQLVAEVSNQPGWIVQPNFDVIAYLDHLTNAQLAFLERNAERLRTGDHVAEYRITRDSVYRGLESGLSVDDMLAAWQNGSGKDLPQNIRVELQEWAAIRDRMVLYRRTDLAEFPNAEARKAAISKGMQGIEVGDRFLLINRPLSKAEVKSFYATIDYSRPPMRCLLIEEDGIIAITEHADLILENQLREWTQLTPNGEFRLTRASIERAIASGRPISALFKLLEERIARLIPPILQIAIRAWAGQSYQVGIGSIQVLHAPSPDTSYAIQNSAILRPYLRGVLAPGYFMVRPDTIEALKAKLLEYGLQAQVIEVAQRN